MVQNETPRLKLNRLRHTKTNTPETTMYQAQILTDWDTPQPKLHRPRHTIRLTLYRPGSTLQVPRQKLDRKSSMRQTNPYQDQC